MRSEQDESLVPMNDLDVQVVMDRIRESMVEGALDDEVEYPTFAAARARSGGLPTLFPEELYYQLEQANLNYDRVLAELSLVESQMPLVGTFVNRFKQELHRLVVFYVNMVAERQVTVNDAVVKTLSQLVDRLEMGVAPRAQEPKVEVLQRQIAELQTRLEHLEARMPDSGSNG
jgi:hypothetical protein